MSEPQTRWTGVLYDAARALAATMAELQRRLAEDSDAEDRYGTARILADLAREQVWLEQALANLTDRGPIQPVPDQRGMRVVAQLEEITRHALRATIEGRPRGLSTRYLANVARDLLGLAREGMHLAHTQWESERVRIENALLPDVPPRPDVLRRLPDAPVDVSGTSRRIQARIRPYWTSGQATQRGQRLRWALRAQAFHEVEVRIGTVDRSWLALPKAFPVEKLPPGQRAHRLTVIFVDPDLAPEPQVATVMLPERGSSDVARFRIFAPDERSRMRARITVLHENRILQTAMLTAPIAANPSQPPKGSVISLEPEVFSSIDLADLGDHTPFDLALVLNHVDERAQATAIAGTDVCLIDLRGVDNYTAIIAKSLSDVAGKDTTYEGLHDPRIGELFHLLAVHGSLLFEALFDRANEPLREALRSARRVQLVAARPGGLLPLEMAYTHHAPKRHAPLCPHAVEALGAGTCSAACPLGTQKDEVVCPLGFWGLSRIIERQSDGALPLGADFGLRLSSGSRRRLAVLEGALFAASAKVDKHAVGSSAGVCNALAATTGGRLRIAESWEGWVHGIERLSPSLLVLLVHTEQIAEDRVQALEIGDGDLLPLANIYPKYVRPEGGAPPVVLLIGCRTALSDVEFQQFPVKFLRHGAALVLGTIATVLGRHAGPVTAGLVSMLAALTEKGEVPFGDALLVTKQKLVAEGQVMAMCLCAHGDAGWILGKAQESAREGDIRFLGSHRKEKPPC